MNDATGTLERADAERPQPGTGVPCCESQCDGVPCPHCDSECAECERARAAAAAVVPPQPGKAHA